MPPRDQTESSEFFAAIEGRARRSLTVEQVLHWRRELRVHDAYRALFGGGEGLLRPEFGLVLKDMVRAAGMDQIGGGKSDADLRELQGRKTMLLHIINRIDRNATKTDEIHRLMRESDRD